MTEAHRTGLWGEHRAAQYLKEQGIRILSKGFQTPFGEIDLVGREKDTIVFVEVRTRKTDTGPTPAESIHPAKQARLTQAALQYLKKFRLEGRNVRFDVILIQGDRLEWIPEAFDPPGLYTL